MKTAKKKVRASTACKKEEERKAREKEEKVSSSAPKTVAKVSKRKPDTKDDRPSKNVAVTLGDVPPKKKSPLKSSRAVGKRVMISFGPVIKGPRCLLTHKDYAIEEVESFIKPTDIAPCDQLGMEDLKALALFDLSRVCLLPQVKFVPSLSSSFD